MDDRYRDTLALIETISSTLTVIERGNQLIQVVKDYLNDGDNESALRVLGKIDADYFETHMYQEAAKSTLLADSIATIIEVLGLGFAILARPREYVC